MQNWMDNFGKENGFKRVEQIGDGSGKKELINKKIDKKRRRALSVNQRLGIVIGL